MSKSLFSAVALSAILALALAPRLVEAQPVAEGKCFLVTATAGGLTRVIATNRARRRLQRYIWASNLTTVPFGPITTTCMGWGVVGVRPDCKSSATVCTPYPPGAAVPVKWVSAGRDVAAGQALTFQLNDELGACRERSTTAAMTRRISHLLPSSKCFSNRLGQITVTDWIGVLHFLAV